LFGGNNRYKQHRSVSYRRRKNKRLWQLLLMLSMPALLVILGFYLMPSLASESRDRSMPRDTLANDAGYLVRGTPIAPDSAGRGNYPTASYSYEIFYNPWQRLDGPINSGKVQRAYTFGNNPGPAFLEQYHSDNSDNQNLKMVQYWEKGRMQLENDNTASIVIAPLAYELISGQVRMGDKETLQLAGCKTPIYGEVSSDNPAPTYKSLSSITSLKPGTNRAEKQVGLIANATLNQVGQVGSGADVSLGLYNVKNVNYVEQTSHNIPNVFWDFLNRSGSISQNGVNTTERLYNWSQQFGMPLSEPYWIKALINQRNQDILIQVFENQILIYNPSVKPELRVDTANIGQHYYEWRYAGNEFVSDTTQNIKAQGASPTPTGARLLIGNESIMRIINIENGRMSRNMLINRINGQVYADLKPFVNISGFSIGLEGQNQAAYQIKGDDFSLTGFSMPVWSDTEKELVLNGQFSFLGATLELKLHYRALAGQDFIEKWVELTSNDKLKDYRVRSATIEDSQVEKSLTSAIPTPEEETLPMLVPVEKTSSVPAGAILTDLMVHESGDGGLYFFSANPLGGEYATKQGITIMQEDNQSLGSGFTSGKAVLGVYSGRKELGYKKFSQYLQNYYSKIGAKWQPVWYSTWYPFTTQINQDVVNTQFEKIKDLGFYDVLHLDAGWEGGMPLEPDPQKFPQGLKPLADKTAALGMGLGIWINPFSNGYSKYVYYTDLYRTHPEWRLKGTEQQIEGKLYTSGKYGVNTDYYAYVSNKLKDLVKNYNVKVIYWDGADWNIPDSEVPNLTEDQRRIERIKGLKRLSALADELRAIRPELVIVAWNSTVNVHLLGAVEQLQLSDKWDLPLGKSELTRLQQFYSATYHMPYYAIWGDWYSISYRENSDNNLTKAPQELIYAEASMIGAGAFNAGASLDLTKAPQDLLDYIKKLFTWRKSFEPYFKVYQHILDFPSDSQIFGEGHIINGKGFIILNNPTTKEVQTTLPLSAPELELNPNHSYRLFDWSSLTGAQGKGEAKPGEGVPITIPPRNVKIIGIEIEGWPN